MTTSMTSKETMKKMHLNQIAMMMMICSWIQVEAMLAVSTNNKNCITNTIPISSTTTMMKKLSSENCHRNSQATNKPTQIKLLECQGRMKLYWTCKGMKTKKSNMNTFWNRKTKRKTLNNIKTITCLMMLISTTRMMKNFQMKMSCAIETLTC